MALMNNNTIQINNYLQNEMSAAERVAFENQLANDKELQYELEVQRNIINAAVNAGMKYEFAKAIKKQFIIRQFIKWGIVIFVSAIILVIFIFRQNILHSSNTENVIKQKDSIATKPFINPPIASINVPFSEYSFDAAKGDTIFYPSGSFICFPANAFVDASGNIINGIVSVNYREFVDPVDFFVSGIPMDYDSAGIKYNFESAGMFEINAYKDKIAVFVNQNAKPQINLSSKNKDPQQNVYFLDTVARDWKFIGKDKITEVKKLAKADQTYSSDNIPAELIGNATSEDYITEEAPKEAKPKPLLNQIKPVKPLKATPGNQTFSTEIEPGSFEELFAYNHLKFEVVNEADSKYKASDADEHWDNMKLDRTSTEGIYIITFTNSTRSVSYKVRPVLESGDYDAAIKVFDEKNKAYEQALNNRVERDKVASDSVIKMSKELEAKWNAENERIQKMNEVIIARNKKMKEMQEQQAKEMERQQKEYERLGKEQQQQWEKSMELAKQQQLLYEKAQEKYYKDQKLSTEVIRTFAITNFGVWNCDNPMLNNSILINSIFTNSTNATINLSTATVVYKGFNGIMQLATPSTIRVMPKKENMILGVYEDEVYYFSYKDFMNAGITAGTKDYTFKMQRSEKKISSYVEIRELIDKL